MIAKEYHWIHNRAPLLNRKCRETYVPPGGHCPLCKRYRVPTNGKPQRNHGRAPPRFARRENGDSDLPPCRRCGGALARVAKAMEGSWGYTGATHEIVECRGCGWTWWVA